MINGLRGLEKLKRNYDQEIKYYQNYLKATPIEKALRPLFGKEFYNLKEIMDFLYEGYKLEMAKNDKDRGWFTIRNLFDTLKKKDFDISKQKIYDSLLILEQDPRFNEFIIKRPH